MAASRQHSRRGTSDTSRRSSGSWRGQSGHFPGRLVSFIRLKEVLKPTCLNEASLADVARCLTDIAGHIGLPGIPIRYRPYRRDDASGDDCDFSNEFFHAEDVTMQ